MSKSGRRSQRDVSGDNDYVVSDGEIVAIPDAAIELSKTLTRLAMIAK